MNVQPLNIYQNYQYRSPSFGDCAVRSADAADNLIKHYTCLGRGFHLDLNKLNDYVIDLIKNGKDKCEFVFCGCSDGSEVFQILMSLVTRMKEREISLSLLPKFTAFDTDTYILDIAKSGRINVSEKFIKSYPTAYPYIFFSEEGPLIKHPNDDIATLEKRLGSPITHSYQFNKDLLKKIEFKTGDMLDEFRKLDDKNCKILFCRNVAQYNEIPYQYDAASALNKNLKSGSLVIVGLGDERRDMVRRLENDKWKDYITLPFCQALNHNNGGKFGHESYISPSPKSVVYVKGEHFWKL